MNNLDDLILKFLVNADILTMNHRGGLC